MLSFYGKQFSTVEINHSFYRMPTETTLLNWAKSVPEGFRFALKANQQITHIKRLRDCEQIMKRFLEVASVLQDGDHLGPILVQLPPTFKFDKPLLEIVFDSVFHITDEGWRKLTLRWAAFFFLLAVLNEVIWRTQTTDFWVNAKVFGFMPLTFLFGALQVPLLMKYAVEPEPAEEKS